MQATSLNKEYIKSHPECILKKESGRSIKIEKLGTVIIFGFIKWCLVIISHKDQQIILDLSAPSYFDFVLPISEFQSISAFTYPGNKVYATYLNINLNMSSFYLKVQDSDEKYLIYKSGKYIFSNSLKEENLENSKILTVFDSEENIQKLHQQLLDLHPDINSYIKHNECSNIIITSMLNIDKARCLVVPLLGSIEDEIIQYIDENFPSAIGKIKNYSFTEFNTHLYNGDNAGFVLGRR